mmetsp:Transcript_39141/g.98389  ORF Transcript_39141/g.98389 Transcript_39141/m.98389 type:complete len:129 (-) Transcript_39141:56-442(-)
MPAMPSLRAPKMPSIGRATPQTPPATSSWTSSECDGSVEFGGDLPQGALVAGRAHASARKPALVWPASATQARACARACEMTDARVAPSSYGARIRFDETQGSITARTAKQPPGQFPRSSPPSSSCLA